MAPLDGAERVRLRFEPDGAEVRVPSGTPVFDAASWNGIAIDSTCGGHGTCKKCKVRVLEGDVPVSSVDPRAFSAEELRAGWRLACRAPARGDLVIEVPPLQTRPKAALVGVGRHVILRPAVQKRHLVLDEPTMEDQRSDFERAPGRARGPRAARGAAGAAHAGPRAAQRELERDRRDRRRRADRRRAGRHDRCAASRSRSTSAPRRSSRRCSTSRRARPPRCARCSTASSRSAPT